MSEEETPLCNAFYWCHRSQRESLAFARDLERKLKKARTALQRIGWVNGHGIPKHTPEADIAREALARIDAGNETKQ